ncbi:hypothetical protein HYE82_03560 [Streptomyces sp. BR123]|uniref:hypothetical protein n=1 Tax=Streptomyces sp. BR123 TaxID=2749828 RepID=UPI0015C4AFB9|nr:hypothetical protein [Streptomyces sp. BR123]NXY93499.1 hypothetical protein [Streptomyces sp. BR123]
MGRAVAPGEPLWLDEDRAWALALAEVERDSCPDCGHPWSEASAPESEFQYDVTLLRCHACAAGARETAAFQKGNGAPEGLHVSITRRG